MSDFDFRREPDPDWAMEAADLAVEELVLAQLFGPQRAALARGLVARQLLNLLTRGVRPVANDRDRAERPAGLQDLPWVEWTGGERPVDSDVRVEVRFRGGTTDEDRANYWDWAHLGGVGDIVAYRLIRPLWRKDGQAPSVDGPDG